MKDWQRLGDETCWQDPAREDSSVADGMTLHIFQQSILIKPVEDDRLWRGVAIGDIPRAEFTPLLRSVSLIGGWHRMRFYWFQRVFGKLFFSRRNGMGPNGAEMDSGVMLEASNQLAIVDETIIPYFGGRVRFQNSWWPALCLHHITLGPGEVVSVVGRHNITLLVEPIGASLTKERND